MAIDDTLALARALERGVEGALSRCAAMLQERLRRLARGGAFRLESGWGEPRARPAGDPLTGRAA